MTPAEASADTIESGQQALGRRIANGFLGILTPAEAAADTIEAGQQALGRRIANGFLTVIEPPEDATRRRTGGDIPGGTGPLGGQLETGRQVDNVINRVAALRQQIDSLPDSVRSQFIPALQRATDEAAAIGSRGFAATATQIRNAANEARRLEQGVARAQRGQSFSDQFGGQGRRGLEFGLQEQSLRGYTAQLQVLQQTLSGLSTTARGPATASFDRLRTAISQAAADGTLDLRGTRREIERLTQEAVEAAAGVAGINPAGLGRRLQRAGDVGRGAFGNLGLGIQQAVFAFDDFFSVTGGLDQRIRAAGNNISQLGFILGGTRGLIAGVAASITAQLIVAYIKWQNAGVGTEDRLKSLNDALSRQKSLVEDLAGAFKSVADEIANIGFSKPGADAAKFQQQLDDIRKKQKEFNQERAAEVNPEVQTERGIIAAREAQLAKAENPGERVRLGLDIRDARAREQAALNRQNARPGISAIEAAIRTNNSTLAVEEAVIRQNAERRAVSQGEQSDPGQTDREIDAARRRNQERTDGLNAGTRVPRDNLSEFIRGAIDNLNQEIKDNSNLFGSGGIANDERRNQIASLTDTLLLLEQGVVAAANRLEVETASAAVGAAKQIGIAQAKVADAIEAGIYGAVDLQVQLDGLTQQLFDAQSELAAAQEKVRKDGPGADLGAATAAREEIATIQSLLSVREQEIAEIDAARVAMQNFNSVLDSFSSEADQIVSAARQEFDQANAQNNFRGNAADMRALEIASENLESAMASQQAVREAVALDRDTAQFGQSDLTRIQASIAGIDELLSYRDSLPFQQREELIRERESLRAAADFEIQRDSSSSGNALAKAREQALEAESLKRGFALQESPAERAGQEVGQQLRDLGKSLVRLPDFDDDRDAAMRQRIAQDAMRQQAPAIFGMADQVQNAVLQGPSRAALQASDVTTMQGASELNRLIRGDDSAKNVDTVELQKQSKSLERLVQIAEENGAPPGVFN